MKIETYTTPNCPLKLRELFLEAYTDKTNSLFKNYNQKILDSDEAICYSVSLLNGVPISGSIAMKRKYYKNSIRTCSRYYVSHEIRNKTLIPDNFKTGIRYYCADQIDQQIDYANSLGYSNYFMTQEKISKRLFSKFVKGVNNGCRYKNWNMEDEKILVCPDTLNSGCWQWVAWRGQLTINDVQQSFAH